MPPLFPPSDLDYSQCIQGAYDDANSCLRVEGVLAEGAIEVAIDAETDNIAIKDPSNGNVLHINNDGSINVDISLTPTTPGTSVSVYNEITGVSIGGTTTILTYTVPAGKTLALTRVEVSGDSIGPIEVEFNNIVNNKKRLHWTSFNVDFDYLNQQNGYSLSAGTVISIVATNDSLNSVGSFNATLQGIL